MFVFILLFCMFVLGEQEKLLSSDMTERVHENANGILSLT